MKPSQLLTLATLMFFASCGNNEFFGKKESTTFRPKGPISNLDGGAAGGGIVADDADETSGGGATSSGSESGGSAAGGSSAGGSESGGSAAGGSSAGGSESGGSAAGGSESGGSSAGGSSAGGSSAGGSAAGGSSAGGSAAGGSAAGGSSAGGSSAGGSAAGGSSAGGSTAGGSSAGGSSAGGSSAGGSSAGGSSTNNCHNELELYSDSNADGIADDKIGSVKCYEGSYSAIENYNHVSGSSNIKIGPKELPHQSHVFCYKNSTGSYLFITHNKGNTTSIKDVRNVNWSIKVSKNELQDQVIVSDEPNSQAQNNISELLQISASNTSKNYVGDWNYSKDSDGGVIGPLKTSNFKIAVEVLSADKITHLRVYSSDNKRFDLEKSRPSAFILESKSVCE